MDLTIESPEFVAWLAGCQKIVSDYYAKYFPTLPLSTLSAEEGEKYIRIVVSSGELNRSVFAFVAKNDITTKMLGSVKRGDVLKAANWKQPAKNSRGNLFDRFHGLSQVSEYGAR
jgi:hypothetical protein